MSASDFGGLCPNGHDLPTSAAYCPTCGAPAYERTPPPPTNVWSAPKAPPPPPPPLAWQPPYYAAPGAYYPPPVPPWAVRRPLNALAVVSVVCAIVWMFWLGSVAAVVLGHIALRQTARSGERGQALAITGLVLGYLELLLLFASILLVHGYN